MENFLKEKLEQKEYEKLISLENNKIMEFVAEAIKLCRPESVFVCTDTPEDRDYVRQYSIKAGEETKLAIEGHTIHFDGFFDQARDKAKTRFLLPKGLELGANFNCLDKEEGVREVKDILKDSMVKAKMIVRFFSLGPIGSSFSILCLQITDSGYVAHSEDILYRPAYEEFKRAGREAYFFRFLHSAGELEGNVSKNIDKRRVYINIEDGIVYSANTQYGGNTIGLKKLALRQAINKASKEDWLAEHMFIMGVHGPEGRVTYFSGAFPSACGKTSTSMLEKESIIGDDIAYLKNIDGRVYGINVERGIFGIAQDVNPVDDPIIYDTLTSPGDVIFANVLYTDEGKPYWLGMGQELPEKGINYSGKWESGKIDSLGNEIPVSHKNARYVCRLSYLRNCDPHLDDPAGVPVDGIIYGGRDSNICVPVEQSFNWEHGVITKGASLESETTAATLGQEGVRTFNLMSNLDFLSVPIGKYLQMHLDFGEKITAPPIIFSVNYFLKDKDSKFLNEKNDKSIWMKWMELRIHKEVIAIETPTGYIPEYKDLKLLFKEHLNKEYTAADYEEQFKLRIPELIQKNERIEHIYKKISNIPPVLFQTLEEQRKRLEKTKSQYGEYISPLIFVK